MTRSWDLLRWVLNQAQLCPGGFPLVVTIGIYNGQHYKLDTKEYDYHEVCEHILLLGDAGLAEVRCLGHTYKGTAGAKYRTKIVVREETRDVSSLNQ